MRARLGTAVALAALALVAAVPSGAHHGGTCSVAALTEITDSPKASVIEGGQIQSWKVTVGAGEHYVWVQPINGDVWVQVCKAGTTGTHACSAGNFGNLPELCLFPGLGGNPGVGPPLIGPGQFRVLVRHCFELDPDAGVCDYSSGLAPDDTIPAPPIAYTAVAH